MKRWLKIYYVEPEESAIIGSFVFDDIVMGDVMGKSSIVMGKSSIVWHRTMLSLVAKKGSRKPGKTAIILD